MVLAAISGFQIFVMGLMLVVTISMVRRSAIRRRKDANYDPLGEAQAELRKIEARGAGSLRDVELRLYDFQREVEARVQTRMTQLDEVIRKADEEIYRLQGELARQKSGAVEEPATAQQELDDRHESYLIGHLAEAGYSPDQIAAMVEMPAVDVHRRLGEINNRRSRAA